jgi:hypothetical protein
MTGKILQGELDNAMGEAAGCGGSIGHEEIIQIERRLAGLWKTLPKNADDNVDRRSLRYAIHRYFNREWSIHIRGFEPSRPANASGWGSDDILGQRVPGYVESVLESKHKLMRGFTLNDAAYMIATIEQLMFDWEGTLLEQVYGDMMQSTSTSLDMYLAVRVLESYVVYWLLRADADSAAALLSNRTLLEHSIPHWDQVSGYIRGQVRYLEFKRRQVPLKTVEDNSARARHNAMQSLFSFEDIHNIVGEISKSFASFWDSECASMKVSLFDMDTHRMGRVSLSKFYGTGMDADWRFGESEAYLRELGALDETSRHGKQVIVSNYMQAASNCVISTPHYLVCCRNDCEILLQEIETAVGSPKAEPAQLLALITDMPAQSSLDDDFPPRLDGSLPQQLEQIAAAHEGHVPLHGRLFAQWLHYAFPRECAFPHKVGIASAITPSEYGDDFYASAEEMRRHVSDENATAIPASVKKEDIQWMSQWSPEEELIAEHVTTGFKAPWDKQQGRTIGMAAALFGLAALCVATLARISWPKTTHKDGSMPFNKCHFV